MTEPDRPGIGALPPWLENAAALSWRLVVIILLGFVLWLIVTTLWTVSAAIVVSVLVAAAFAPLVLRLRAQGRSRNAAAAIAWVLAIAVVCGIPILLLLALLPELAAILQGVTAGVAALEARLDAAGLPMGAGAAARSALGSLVDATGSTGSAIVSAAADVVTVVVLSVFLTFFLLRDGDRAWAWVFRAAGDDKRELVSEAGDAALRRIGGYVRGMTVLAAFVAVTDWLFMWLLGVPLAVSLAVLAFLCSFVPYVGGVVATLVILGVSLAALGPGQTILLLLLMAGRSAVMSTFIRPTVYGRTMRINPALVLVAIAVGAQLGGVLGLLAAVPLTAAGLATARAAIAIVEPASEQSLPTLVPAWIDRLAQVSWRVLVGLGLAAALVAIAVNIPLAVTAVVGALLMAAALAPVVAALVTRGWTRGKAAAGAVGGVTAVIAGLVLLSFWWLGSQAGDLGAAAVSGMRSVDDAAGGALGLLVDAVQGSAGDLIATLASAVDAAATVITTVALSILLGFFLLRDGPDLWRRTVARVVPGARRQVGEAGARAVEVLGGYIIGTAAVSLVGAGSQFLIMVVLGLPLAVPVFVLSFILCFIPYLGSFVSTGIAFLIAVSAGSVMDVALMALFTVVFNIVQGNIVSPIVYGRTVHLHPAIVLLAIPAGAAIAGILGMFLVVPVLGVIAATWRHLLGALSGTQVEPEPDAPVTQGQRSSEPIPSMS